jgi:hypothetical protein
MRSPGNDRAILSKKIKKINTNMVLKTSNKKEVDHHGFIPFIIFCGTPVLLQNLLKQDAKFRLSGVGSIDKLRTSLNPA